MLCISSGEDCMTFHVFVFLLLFFLLLSLAWLGRLSLLHHDLAHWGAGALYPVVRRLLKPRTPCDCPACCHSSAFSTGVDPSPLPVRPWCEVKSRRGAPKRINTQGFDCPNHQCQYFGITDVLSMPWLGMASMVTLNRSRPFAARPAAPRSMPDATPHCTG